MVTHKLDLDQMSERNIPILKDTYIWLHSLSVANFGFICLVYIRLQKEDIAETAVHFVLKWGDARQERVCTANRVRRFSSRRG